MKNFQESLKDFKNSIDKHLEVQLDTLIAGAAKEDQMLAKALTQTKEITLAGGKRIRGALLVKAYLGAGGREKKKIMKVAVAIELLHIFFLVHDDIIDFGKLRHGKTTVHEFCAKEIKTLAKSIANHIGTSMAIMIGDLLQAKAVEIILKAGFGAEETLQALKKMQEIIETTISGQSQDISIENAKNVNEKEVLTMYENKTARYTFEGPLMMGVILAGLKDLKTFKLLKGYALPLGIAFQIQDDVLGIFGEEKKIGKSVVSDIEEGKKSLMVVYAMEKASANEKKTIDSILGKKNPSKKEISDFKNILISTGAKDYAQALAKKYLLEGSSKIKEIILMQDSKNFLLGLAQYLENREI